MTISEGYRHAKEASKKCPYTEYPYLGIPDEEDEETLEQNQV